MMSSLSCCWGKPEAMSSGGNGYYTRPHRIGGVRSGAGQPSVQGLFIDVRYPGVRGCVRQDLLQLWSKHGIRRGVFRGPGDARQTKYNPAFFRFRYC